MAYGTLKYLLLNVFLGAYNILRRDILTRGMGQG